MISGTVADDAHGRFLKVIIRHIHPLVGFPMSQLAFYMRPRVAAANAAHLNSTFNL
jgi:hypothetical protein